MNLGSSEKKVRILLVAPYYLPAYKAGGPVRSLSNLVEWLGDEFEFYILTSDRDAGDTEPFPHVQAHEWQPVGKAQVRYLSPDERRFVNLARLLKLPGIDYDILYLNSFFSALTRNTLILRRFGRLPEKPTLLAPRGEFSTGALALKRLKKQVYIKLSQSLELYKGVVWQAANEDEAVDFAVGMNSETLEIKVAPYPLPKTGYATDSLENPTKFPKHARILFLSRVTPKKNLSQVLEILMVAKGEIQFDIYGPISDDVYWSHCQSLIQKLPGNVQVSYKGAVVHDQVFEVYSQYHAFFFPTLGDNYGRVVLEALSAGCLVITSDQIPWQQLGENRIGWSLPLSDQKAFEEAVAELVSMDESTFRQYSDKARKYAKHITSDPSRADANREMFLSVK